MAIIESELVKMVVNTLKNQKEDLDLKILNGKTALLRIQSDLIRLAFITRSFKLTSLLTTIAFSTALLTNFFVNKLQRLAPKEILSDKYDIPSSVKDMLSRELGGLASRHFDHDFSLQFDILKKDLTIWRSLETADDTTKVAVLNKMINVIFEVVSFSSREALEEMDQKVSVFLNDTIQALEGDQTLRRFAGKLNLFVAGLHKELYGWPLGRE